jgi:hypothetical protein
MMAADVSSQDDSMARIVIDIVEKIVKMPLMAFIWRKKPIFATSFA